MNQLKYYLILVIKYLNTLVVKASLGAFANRGIFATEGPWYHSFQDAWSEANENFRLGRHFGSPKDPLVAEPDEIPGLSELLEGIERKTVDSEKMLVDVVMKLEALAPGIVINNVGNFIILMGNYYIEHYNYGWSVSEIDDESSYQVYRIRQLIKDKQDEDTKLSDFFSVDYELDISDAPESRLFAQFNPTESIIIQKDFTSKTARIREDEQLMKGADDGPEDDEESPKAPSEEYELGA